MLGGIDRVVTNPCLIPVSELRFKGARFAPRSSFVLVPASTRGRTMGAISLARASFMALERITREQPRSRSGAANPTRAHVHPNSRLAGTFEDDFFYSYAQGETDRLYKKAV